MDIKKNPYKIVHSLSQGRFTEVFLAKDDRNPSNSLTNKLRIIKKIAIPKESDLNKLNAIEDNIEKEASALKKCACENIINYFHLYKTPNNCCLVFEYCENGDLSTFLKNERHYIQFSETEREKKAWEILRQLLRGVAVIHKNNYMHGNIKSSNIFICDSYKTFKLGDLGLAKRCQTDFLLADTVGYCAPEIIKKKNSPNDNDKKADIWSLGTVFYEILVGEKLFKKENEIFELDLEKAFLKLSMHNAEMLKLMLERDPDKRASAEDLVGKIQYLEIEVKDISSVKISHYSNFYFVTHYTNMEMD